MVRPIVVTKAMSHEAITSTVPQPFEHYICVGIQTKSQIYSSSILTMISSQLARIYDESQVMVWFLEVGHGNITSLK